VWLTRGALGPSPLRARSFSQIRYLVCNPAQAPRGAADTLRPMLKENTPRRRSTLPVVAAALQPVTKRLARMEALLIEMRHEQDVKFKRLAALQAQIDGVAERIEHSRATLRHPSRRSAHRPGWAL
jgi:hypothetical protein